jgi:hypothetical protein
MRWWTAGALRARAIVLQRAEDYLLAVGLSGQHHAGHGDDKPGTAVHHVGAGVARRGGGECCDAACLLTPQADLEGVEGRKTAVEGSRLRAPGRS